ncbi:MAG: hypothetical protein ACE5EM_06070 [Sphingomonadales bacterium]
MTDAHIIKNGAAPVPHPFDDTEESVESDSGEIVTAMRRFAALIERTPWFTQLGEVLDGELEKLTRDYLDALGCPEVTVAPIREWETAELAATNPEIDDTWWDTEEQLRLAATAQALEVMDEDDFMAAVGIVVAKAADIVFEAAEQAAAMADVDDQELIRAAAGAASKACHQAALVILSGGEQDHPFALKFRLFEAGRWPVSVTGGSFNLF